MFKIQYASNSHSYNGLILALGIVRKPTVWGLLLHNILAYMTLAGILTQSYTSEFIGGRASDARDEGGYLRLSAQCAVVHLREQCHD